MNKAKLYLMGFISLLGLIGLAMAWFERNEKSIDKKPLAGSPEQMEIARRAKALKKDKELEEEIENETEEILNSTENGKENIDDKTKE